MADDPNVALAQILLSLQHSNSRIDQIWEAIAGTLHIPGLRTVVEVHTNQLRDLQAADLTRRTGKVEDQVRALTDAATEGWGRWWQIALVGINLIAGAVGATIVGSMGHK